MRQVLGLVPKLRRLASLVAVVIAEVVATLRFAGYGLRALGLHRDVSFFAPNLADAALTRTKFDAAYGPRARNVMDVYYPLGIDSPPVVLFVHGGTWCSGEKWQYSPIGKKLSAQGITTCVMSYTLFPEAGAEEMVEEVNLALDWVMKNVASSCSPVTLLGHSAGAHTSMMAILNRAKHNKRMPDLVVGMCGVYDIATHYELERSLGVHELSAMARAIGGRENFTAQSPTCILSNLCNSEGRLSLIERAQLRQLPKITLMTSALDTTVPS